jgi:hypothetical protein
MTEGGTHPPAKDDDARLGVREKPRQIQDYWWEFMDALPSQVLRPLRDAFDGRLTLAHRRCRRNLARLQLHAYKRDLREWMHSVDAMMLRHGEPSVDKLDPEQAQAFALSLTDSERRALAKCQRVRAAIAYAEMTLEWLDWSLSRGD